MKTLIAYTTKHGCTEKLANKLAEQLSGEKDVLSLDKNKINDLSTYDTVIVGGCVMAGRVRGKAIKFCNKYINELKQKKLGLFISCMDDENEEKYLKEQFPEELVNHSTALGYFGGEIIFDKMGFLERFMMKMIAKSKTNADGNAEITDQHKIKEKNIKKFAETINNA